MSEETKSPLAPAEIPTPEASDPIKNLKAEMSRKLDNYGESLQKLTDTLNALVQPRQTTAPAEQPTEDLGKMLWAEPEKAVRAIEDRATQKITKQLEQTKVREQKQMEAVQSIYNEFPELSDQSHPATQEAIKIFNSLPKEEQTPIAMKYAAREAADKFDLKPKSKRSSSTDDSFTLSGGRNSGAKRETGSEYDKQVAATAAMFGLDISNEKVKARLKEKASRTNWMDYADLSKK